MWDWNSLYLMLSSSILSLINILETKLQYAKLCFFMTLSCLCKSNVRTLCLKYSDLGLSILIIVNTVSVLLFIQPFIANRVLYLSSEVLLHVLSFSMLAIPWSSRRRLWNWSGSGSGLPLTPCSLSHDPRENPYQ